jgi:hypothetical protein
MFVPGADAQAKALGAQPSAVYVEHPIQERTDDGMRSSADRAVEAIVAKLLA